jgi:hypothetical protein
MLPVDDVQGMKCLNFKVGVSGSALLSQKSGTCPISGFLRTRNLLWVLGSQEREFVVACYKMNGKLYPDTSVSEKAQKRFFRWVRE